MIASERDKSAASGTSAPAKRAVASGSRSTPVTSCPMARRRRAIGAPMAPRPITVTFAMSNPSLRNRPRIAKRKPEPFGRDSDSVLVDGRRHEAHPVADRAGESRGHGRSSAPVRPPSPRVADDLSAVRFARGRIRAPQELHCRVVGLPMPPLVRLRMDAAGAVHANASEKSGAIPYLT